MQAMNNMTYYKVPENPFKLQDFTQHFYGNLVPADINLQIEKENASLAKEIEDRKNDKIVSDIRNIYVRRIGEYKTEFELAS